ncbi:MAG: ntrC4 [Deltaproteobacteria bacterium]|nr:ntrC4 [Deltaproteobacteria bacterium]
MTEIIGEAYKEIKKLVKQYAKEDKPILLVGETGTGKELFANLYKLENERKGKKLTVDCSTITSELLSSEIFGHVRGAFTGATGKRIGKLVTCDKGILFLDELGKASKEFQAAILRVAEQNSFSPVGSDEEKKEYDVRIIAATSNLANIREDLQYRFNCLLIPPLQAFDIPKIAEKYLGKSLKENIIKELMSKKYPGNVRQLRRECDRLKTERGNKIFGIRPYQGKYHNYDYDRFQHDYELWFKYFQPVLDKHKTCPALVKSRGLRTLLECRCPLKPRRRRSGLLPKCSASFMASPTPRRCTLKLQSLNAKTLLFPFCA